MHAITCRNVFSCLQNFYKGWKIKHLILQKLTLPELSIYTVGLGYLWHMAP